MAEIRTRSGSCDGSCPNGLKTWINHKSLYLSKSCFSEQKSEFGEYKVRNCELKLWSSFWHRRSWNSPNLLSPLYPLRKLAEGERNSRTIMLHFNQAVRQNIRWVKWDGLPITQPDWLTKGMAGRTSQLILYLCIMRQTVMRMEGFVWVDGNVTQN